MAAYSTQAHRALIAQAAHALAAGKHLHCGSDCAGYHRGWMLLQHLGLISGLSSERGFIVEAIRGLARQRPLRAVLIAGCADFGLLSVLHEALGDATQQVRVIVRDRCETPLALCRSYAQAMGFEIHTERQDLVSAPANGAHDLVLMHSLLSFCAPAERGDLLARLASQLGKAGTLLAYQSIRPAPAATPLAYDDDEVSSMVMRAVLEGDPEIDAAQITRFVQAFCQAKKTMSVPSIASVVADAETRGLMLLACRLLFDSASSSHRAATPASHHLKYEFRFATAA